MSNQMVADFLASGGKITQVSEGVVANDSHEKDSELLNCRCGCNGDYTDHSMRAGESGRCSSIVIR